MKRVLSRNLIIGLLIVGFALILYYPVLTYNFVFDDEMVIVGNRTIRDASHLLNFFTEPTYSFYRPLRSVSYLIDYRYWRLNPVGFHITNILLHGLCCFSFYLLLKLWGAGTRTGLAALLIFLVHPVNIETVAYLSSRAELLGTLFTLLFLLSALRHLTSRRHLHLLISLLFLLGALLSKESFAIAPFLLLILQPHDSSAGHSNRKKNLPRIRIFVFSLILTGVFLAYRFILLNAPTNLGQFDLLLTYPQILIKLPSVMLTYFRLLILPINLSPHHPLAIMPLPSPAVFGVQAALLAGIVILLIGCRRAGRLPFYSALWILIALLPVSNFYPMPRLLAEKYLYLPSLGFALLFASLCRGRTIAGKKRQLFLIGLVIFIFAILTLVRQPVWRSNYSLWKNTSSSRPSSPLTLYNWGVAQFQSGRVEKGLETLKTAEAILPGQPIILERIADGHGLLGQYDRAIELYRELLQRFPESPTLHLKIGLTYEEQGCPELAALYYDEALAIAGRIDSIKVQQLFSVYQELTRLRELGGGMTPATPLLENILSLSPSDPEINYRLGQAYESEERWAEALDCYSRVIDQTGPTAELLYRQGKTYHGAKEFKKAMQSYYRALRQDPKFYPPYFDLGGLLAGYGEYEPAERFFRAGLKLNPDDYRAHTNLGSIYQFQEKYPEAIAEYERSLQIEESYKARYNLGFLYLNKLAKPAAALPHLQEALHQSTDPAQKKKLKDALSQITLE
jgi:protein O-mannosyl-transferase